MERALRYFVVTHTSILVEGKRKDEADDCHGSAKAVTRQGGGPLRYFSDRLFKSGIPAGKI